MAPPTPGRHRGPRPQVNNNIGEAGRTTNIAPPKGVPRDSAGHERPEAFFDSEEYPRGDDDDDQQYPQQSAPRRRANQRRDPSEDDEDDEDFGDQVRKSNQSAAANKKQQQQQQQSARKRQPNGRTPVAAQRARGAERPDKYMLGDDRGRKTGITKAVTRRDEDGMEDPNDFFNSSPGAKSVATTTAGARSTIKKASRAYRYDEDDDDDAAYDEDGNDMQDDEGTSISPLTYQRQHPSTTTTGRAPSALRHSTSASGERSVSRKGLSSPQANGLASSASKSRGGGGGTRRRLSSFGGEDEAEEQQHDDYYDDNEDEQEAGGRGYDEAGDSVEEEEEEEDEEEEEEAVRAVLGAKKTTTASSSAAKKQSRKSVASTSGRRRSSPDYRRDASLDAEDEEEEEASPSGLMKLDRNGRPVPADRPKNKGKGRASDLNGSPAEGGRGRQREVDVFEQQEEEVVQQEYVEQDDYYQDEFGGGGDDEEGEGQYDPHDYGDAAGGDDDFDSAGEDGDGPSRHDVDVQEVDEDGNPISDQDEQMQGPSSRPYAAKNKGKGKGKGKAKPKPRTQSESPQRRSTAGNRSRQKQSQQPVITEISRKRAREAGTVDIDGVRRSNREKVPRLEYWRNERIIYERRRSGVGLKAIVRVPKEDPAPLTKAGGHKKVHGGVKRSGSARAASSGRARSVKTEVPEEQGCDDMTDPDGLVWSWEGEAETTRRIAFTERMMDPKMTLDGKFAYQKIYQELDYLASGVLTIPPGGEKGLKSSKDNSYVFCCLQGSVSVTVHRTRFAIGPGGTFFVPRGNMYQIVATSNREVRLFFAQGRRVIEYGDGETRPDTREDSMRFIENEELQAVPEQDEEEEEEDEEDQQ
ncbi:hypothetical protein C6P46_005940 [Rhodotorula mucilaginosa]|uniref:CENP-C homolog n=1 Tax=Rhodotorula mucilaginosa TaxID=5537 RepID=A0A9P7B8G9_RHOMI|nr:hypothetical protein C6P46_005940 [Rhodotorula mucilaginosa]